MILRKYFVLYKYFLLFLGVFFLCYIGLTFGYNFFLDCFNVPEIDTVTTGVALNVQQVLGFFDADSSVNQEKLVSSFTVVYHQVSVAQIVEGCNGVSVIILFVSFVVAFSGHWKSTLLFIFFGSLFIYILNVFRIAVLSILLFYFSEQTHLLHGVIFPLFIYSVVFVLWVFWVDKYSKYAK
jgi:exosortase family protein XrtF